MSRGALSRRLVLIGLVIVVLVAVAPTPGASGMQTGRPVDEQDPLRVLLAGDSVLVNLEPALESALEGGGAADASSILSTTVPRTTPDFAWGQALADVRPDVAITLVGGWELDAADGAPTDQDGGAWAARYREMVHGLVDQVSAAGTHLIWVAMPVVGDGGGERSQGFALINQVVAGVAAERPDELTAVDASGPITTPSGAYLEVGEQPDGIPVRLRRLDRTHLCPEAVRRVNELILAEITDRWDVPLLDDWQHAPWSAPWQVPRGSECPPPAAR